MRKLKSSVKSAVVSTVALTSTAAIIYAAPNLVSKEAKTNDIGNKLKLDVEKIDRDTVKVSIDNIKDIPKSIQFSLKLDGDIELANGESSIKDLINPQVKARLANNEYQEKTNEILTDYTYNKKDNTIDVLITAENSLPKNGNKIEVFELDVKAKDKLTKEGGTTYKVVPNDEDEYKYLSVTNKEYNDLGVAFDNTAITLNTAPTIETSKEFINIVEGETLELTPKNLGITMKDADRDEVTLEVKDLSQSNKPVITTFSKTTPGLYSLECRAIDSNKEKSEPIELQVYVDYEKVTTKPTITRNGQELGETITINGGDIFKPLENVKAVDAKGRVLDVQVSTNKALELDPEEDTTYVLTYTAVDTYGNEAKKEVNLHVKANKAPVISGVKNHTLKVGDTFDPRNGVTVTDEDSDIELVVDSNVNTSIAGEYKVSYSATDNKGKTTRVQSIVTVNPKAAVINHTPVISANDTTIKLGSEFNALDIVTAHDHEDQDLTSSVEVVKDDVDTSKEGKYTVTYRVQDKDGATATKTITVTVVKALSPAKEITISNKFDKLYVGESANISAAVNEEADVKDIEWSVSNSDVLAIEVKGNTAKVVAKGEGKAVITATTTDGSNISDSFEVTVEEFKASIINNIPVISANDTTIKLGEKFDPLSIVTAYDKEDKDLTSSVKVIENNVDINKEGSYTVRYRVEDKNGASSTKTITVTVIKEIILANKINIGNKFDNLYLGASKVINAAVNEEADIKDIKWSVSDSDVLEVKSNGNTAKIIAKGEGKAVVTATTTDGSNISDSFEVTVKDFTNKDVIPDAIMNIIDTKIVTPISGYGDEKSPVELEVKNVLEDDFNNFVKDLKKSNSKIVDTVETDEYTMYKIKLTKARLFARDTEYFVELKIDNSLANASKYKEIVVNTLKVDEDNNGSNDNGSNDNDTIINSIPVIFANDTIIKLGEEFNPLSIVTAYDKEDKDLTSSVKVIENNVNINQEGSYTVRYSVQDKDGAIATKTITVTVIKEVVLANEINIGNKFKNLYLGASKEINAAVNEEADIKDIKWSVSDSNVLELEANGNIAKIIAKGEGKAVVTATTTDGSNISDSFEVIVQDIKNNDEIPNIIVDIIDTNVVTPVSGHGNFDSPIELEVKAVKEEDFTNFAKDLKNMNSKIVDTIETEEFTIYKIKLTKFRLFGSNDESYVELKIDNSLENASKYKEIIASTLKGEEDNNNSNGEKPSGGNGSTNNGGKPSGGSGSTNNNGKPSGGNGSNNNNGNSSTGSTNNNKVENEAVNDNNQTLDEKLDETATLDDITNENNEENIDKLEELTSNDSKVETAEAKKGNNIIAYIGVGIAAVAGVLFAKSKKDE